MIEKAKKPYIFVGGGAILSGASETLKAFVEKVDAPVCDTLMGKGAYDGHISKLYRNAWNAWNKDIESWCERM